ncbi:Hypothetical_protein [Hexamita inflata]|uniref:Hypothetical_protein n=1 Tax=Hexamita inflata TaxID=28002 RepID=A0ABP1HH81_9EUKA
MDITLQTFMCSLGIIGQLNSNQSQIINVKSQLLTNTSFDSEYVSALVGFSGSPCNISNIKINQSNYTAYSSSGGIIGYCANVTNMNNISVLQLNISSYLSGSGGIIGSIDNTTVTLKNSVIQSIWVCVNYNKNESGIILGYDFGRYAPSSIPLSIFIIQNSSSSGTNYINNVLQGNCATLNNAQLQKGC